MNSLCAWDGQYLQSTPLNVDSNNFECSSVTVYVGKRGRRRRTTRAGMAKERLTLCDERSYGWLISESTTNMIGVHRLLWDSVDKVSF